MKNHSCYKSIEEPSVLLEIDQFSPRSVRSAAKGKTGARIGCFNSPFCKTIVLAVFDTSIRWALIWLIWEETHGYIGNEGFALVYEVFALSYWRILRTSKYYWANRDLSSISFKHRTRQCDASTMALTKPKQNEACLHLQIDSPTGAWNLMWSSNSGFWAVYKTASSWWSCSFFWISA